MRCVLFLARVAGDAHDGALFRLLLVRSLSAVEKKRKEEEVKGGEGGGGRRGRV